MIGTSHTLEKLLETAGRLYTLPVVAVRVLQMTDRPDVDTRDLKKCLENDPALTSKVLRVVNSSLFGLSRPVSDLNQALGLLGMKPLKLLVLGFSLPDNLFSGVSRDLLSRYWTRTLIKAVAARELSEAVWRLPGDDAFISGLLDDLGMLVLIQELGEPYIRFVTRVADNGASLAEFETRVLGFDHRQLSRKLLEQWGLPPTVVEALAAARAPETIPELPLPRRPLPQIVHLADLISLLLTKENLDVLPQLLDLGMHYHDLTADEFSKLVNSLQLKVDQLADVLSLELGGGQDYTDVLVQAHARLSIVAAEVAAGVARNEREEQARLEESLLEEVRWLETALRTFTTDPARMVEERELAKATLASAGSTSGGTGHFTASERQPQPRLATEADPAFQGRLLAAVSACRQARCSLTLLLLEIDDFEDLAIVRGPEGVAHALRLVHAACKSVDHPGAVCVEVTESRFAVLLPDCDRSLAVRSAGELLRLIRQLSPSTGQARLGLTASIGAATVSVPPKNFPAQLLIESADRCLYGAQSGGGNSVKSIEL